MELDGVDAALDHAAELLERGRSAGIPIIHIQHDAGAGSPYDVRSEIGAIVDRVAPRQGEAVIVKTFPNSFVQTDLDERLKAGPAHNLLLAGFMTHMCVNSTARGAFNLGYATTVVPGRCRALRSRWPPPRCKRPASPPSPTCSASSSLTRQRSPTDPRQNLERGHGRATYRNVLFPVRRRHPPPAVFHGAVDFGNGPPNSAPE
jgi:hypothetical protein